MVLEIVTTEYKLTDAEMKAALALAVKTATGKNITIKSIKKDEGDSSFYVVIA